MKIRVLVYDNELGYYQLLKDSITAGFEFTLYTNEQNSHGFDVVAFFLNDEIEAIDMLKLYDENISFVLAANNGYDYIQHRDNAYIINIGITHNEIERSLKSLFNELHIFYKKQEAL